MSNCLKTQLKEAVNNNNLIPIGSILVNVVQNTNNPDDRFIETSLGATYKVVSGSCHFTDSTGTQNLGTEITPIDRPFVYISNAEGKVAISSKYAISNFRCENVGYVDAVTLGYMGSTSGAEKMRIYLLNDTLTYGNITDLSKAGIPFSEITMPSGNMSGDVSNIVFAGSGNYNVTDSINLYGTLNIPSGTEMNNLLLSGTKVTATTLQLGNINAYQIYAGDNFTGDVSLIAEGNLKCINLTLNNGIFGTIESLCEKWILKGKEGNVIVNSPVLTFHESTLELNIYRLTFGISSVVVTDYSNNTLGSYNGSTWTYNS